MPLMVREKQPPHIATAPAVVRVYSWASTRTALPAESVDILSLSNKIHYYARNKGSWH